MWEWLDQYKLPGIKKDWRGKYTYKITNEEQHVIDIAFETLKGAYIYKGYQEEIIKSLKAAALYRYAITEIDEPKLSSNGEAHYESLKKGLAAIIKALSIYPLPIYLYHIARFAEEARMNPVQVRNTFRLFLEMQSEFKPNQFSDIAMKQHNINEAVQDAKRRLELEEPHKGYYENGQLKEEKFTEINNVNPNDARAYYSRGNTYFDKKNYDQAISDYTQAINIDPRYADAYYNRGLIYKIKDNLDKAISDFTQAINIDPHHSYVYCSRGIVYQRKNNHDKAISDLTQAINIDPRVGIEYCYRAISYYYQKNFDKAWEDVHKAQEMRLPINSDFLNELKEASGREE